MGRLTVRSTPGRVVLGAVLGELVELPDVGHVGVLASVVSPAQGLPVAEVGASAATVWVDVVSFQALANMAPSGEQAVVFAAAAGPRQDQRLVGPGESPNWIARQRLPPRLTSRRDNSDGHKPGRRGQAERRSGKAMPHVV